MTVWDIILWPRAQFRELQSKFERKTPFQKFEVMRGATDTLLRLTGINLLSDCAWSWLVLSTIILTIQFFVFSFYTTYYYWNENKISAIQIYSILGLAIPVSISDITLFSLRFVDSTRCQVNRNNCREAL